MAQKTISRTTPQEKQSKPKKVTVAADSYLAVNTAAEPSSQDEELWESAIANSIDVIRELANKALADRQAGRTKKITL